MDIYKRYPKTYCYYQNRMLPSNRIFYSFLMKLIPILSVFLLSLIFTNVFLLGGYDTSEELPNEYFESNMVPVCRSFGIRPEFMYEVHAPYNVSRDDIFLAIRLGNDQAANFKLMYETWMEFAPKHTYVTADYFSKEMEMLVGNRNISTQCKDTEKRQKLFCSLREEFKTFLNSTDSKWFCGLRDDVYLNINQLTTMLSCFDPDLNWYIGKQSQAFDMKKMADGKMEEFQFAYGQFYCMSRIAIARILTLFSVFQENEVTWPNNESEEFYSEDRNLGFINELLLNLKLTNVDSIHHDKDNAKDSHKINIRKSVMVSSKLLNDIGISGFPTFIDPSRMISMHCHIHPDPDDCPQQYFDYGLSI